MESQNSFNQEKVEQVVGMEVGTSAAVDAAFIAQVRVYTDREFVEHFAVLFAQLSEIDLPTLRYHAATSSDFVVRTRFTVMATRLSYQWQKKLEAVDDIVFTRLPGIVAPRKGGEPLAITPSPFPLPESSPRGKAVDWSLASSTTVSPKRPDVHPTPVSELHDSVQASIIDLDNRKLCKKLAKYRKKVKTPLPKEDREKLIDRAREQRWRMKELSRALSSDYEGQMNLNVNHNHTLDVSPDVSQVLNRLTNGITELMDKFGAGVGPTVAGFQTLAEESKSVASVLSGTLDTIFSTLSTIMWAIPLIAAGYYAVTSSTGTVANILCVGIGGILAVALPAGLWASIKALWPTAKKTDEDAFYDAEMNMPSPDTLSHIVTLALTFFTTSGDDTYGICKSFMRSMTTYSRSINGWKELSSFVIGVVESFVNFVRVQFGADRISMYKTGLLHIDNWCSRVMHKLNEAATGGEIMTPEIVREIVSLRDEGRELTDLYRLNKECSPILHKYLSQLDELCTHCSAAIHMAKGGRAPPACLILTGDPGVGKTYLTKIIINYICAACMSRERAEELGWIFDSELFSKGISEYWNGYAKQFGVAIDDFGQAIPSPGQDNDFIDIIRMVSCWAFPLNFADLFNKGKNFFDSKLVLCTTNLDNIDNCLAVIAEPNALTRRFDFPYKVILNDEFAIQLNGQRAINVPMVEAYAKKHGDYPYHAWTLFKHKFAVGPEAATDYSRSYGLQEVMDAVVSRINTNKNHYATNVENIKRMVKARYGIRDDDYQAESGIPSPPSDDEFVDSECDQTWYNHASALFDTATLRAKHAILPCLSSLANLAFRVKDELANLTGGWNKLARQPIFIALLNATAMPLVMLGMAWASGRLMNWLAPTKSQKKKQKLRTKEALRRKDGLDDELTAQMIDIFEPQDFQVVQETEGTYQVVRKFTPSALLRAYNRIMGITDQSNVPEGPRFAIRKVTANHIMEADAEPQADIYGDDIANVAFKNLVKIEAHDGGRVINIGHCLFVNGEAAIMPNHYDFEFKRALADETLSAATILKFINISYPKLNVSHDLTDYLEFPRIGVEQDDVMCVKIRNMRTHRNITHLFVSDSDIQTLTRPRIRLDTIDGSEVPIRRSRHLESHRRLNKTISVEGKSYTVATTYEYEGFTRKGDCGGIVCLEETPERQARRIVGIHIAGKNSLNTGLCNILTQEKVLKMLKNIDEPLDMAYLAQADMTILDKELPGTFVPLCIYPKHKNSNPVSVLTPTKLHGAWGELKKVPAPLRPFRNGKVIISPMANAIEPYSSPVHSYDVAEVDRAAYQAFRRFFELTTKHDRRILSFEEAVAGIPGTSINGIPRNTSPGEPWVFEGMSNKKPFFGKDGDYDFSSDECARLRKEVTAIIDAAIANKRMPHYWVDFLKDELRSLEKAQAGKTRLISSAPLAYVIAFRMYFLSFTSAVQDTRIRNGVAVGINPYTEWEDLAREMQSMGKECVAGDFKGFDSSEQPDIHNAILRQINNWYDDGEENRRVREILWLEVTHSRHIGGTEGKINQVYQWNKSLPSGHPATSVINSFYNLTLFNLVWTDIMGLPYSSRFNEFVYACVYGDDNILNVDSAVTGKFNQETITRAMAARHMTYTTEDKLSEVTKTRSLHQISFLKRAFRKDTYLNKYVGPQELDSILYVPYWCKDKARIGDTTEANLEFTYTELAMHAPEMWDRHAELIKEAAWQRMKIRPQNNFTRKEYLLRSQECEFVWPV